MSDPSHINRVLAENCENCRVTASQNTDGSSITKFSYEFCLQPVATGLVGETPLFSTGRTGSKLDWFLKFGPDFRFNLHLLRWDGSDDVKVHIVCCWKIPFLENKCTAINENLDPRLPLPSFWSVRLPTDRTLPCVDYNPEMPNCISKLLLDISLEDRISGRTEHLKQYLASALEDGRFSDITLVAGDRRFPTHRVILLQRCPYILRDLDSYNNQIIIMHGIDPEILEMVLEFLYTARLKNVQESRLEALLAIACKWFLSDLEHFCKDLIKRRNMRDSHQSISVARNGNDVVTLSADLL